MDIHPKEEIRKYIQKLWHSYLLAEIVNDLMLSEIANGLYIENPDMDWIKTLKGRNPLIDGIVSIGFSDTIDDALENLYTYPENFIPYSELTHTMNMEDMYEKIISNIISQTDIYDTKEISENPYNKHIRIHKEIKNKLTLHMYETLPYEFFQSYNTSYNEKNPFLHIKAGFFKEAVSYPVLLENNNVWMSIVMSEILSMKNEIEKAQGRVITYGLGIGYYTFMVSQKENVESVTVIEMNEEIIDLFKKQMLPHFPNRNKIKIINGNALEYIKIQKDGDFDFAFADFWEGVEDGLLFYLKFMPLTKNFEKTHFDFWIERCFMEYYFRPVLMKMLYEKTFKKHINIYDDNKQISKVQKNFESFLKKKNIIISSIQEINYLLSDENVKNLIHNFAVFNYKNN